jgi:phage protein D/phage baseplate assembly protein gpV
MTVTVTTAAAEILVDGQTLPQDLARRLVSVRVASRLSQPSQCELAFATWTGAAAELDRIPLGATVSVRMAQDSDSLFDGEVTCIELVHEPDGAATARIRAYDKLHRLRKRQQLRVFESVTAQGLANELVSGLGLEVDADESGPEWERIVQDRHNDLELLVEVANRAGLYPVVEGEKLRLVTLDGYGPPVELVLGKSLVQARIEANLDLVGRKVTALGWSPQRAEVIEQEAKDARSGRRIDLEPDVTDAGGEGEFYTINQPGGTESELAALAQADLDARTGRAVTVSGVANGDAALRAGCRIELDNVAQPVRGTYVVYEVVHTVDATGYLSTFSTEPPRLKAQPPGASVTLGRVTEVDGTGRVRVSLPAHGDLDAGWLPVLCPGAGSGKGFVALPDVDDLVVVLLPHGVPMAGIVLGSLYGTVEPPDSAGVTDGAVKRWSLRTAQGQSIVVDNADKKIRVENDAGSYVELGPDRMRLHAATDLVVEAPGKAITIKGKSVDFVYAAG